MLKARNTLAIAAIMALTGSALHANFTLFDMAKDSMYIAKGEFVGLQRTAAGDRLTLRCDTMIKGELAPATQVTLEAFEPARADEALGRPAIVAFNLINGKHYFLHHPFSQRGAFYFETDDKAVDGLVQSERALRNFIAINEPHRAVIEGELRKRLQHETLGYEGEFDMPLINAWKSELLNQAAWSGTWAAFDAAKALVDHQLFKGVATVDDARRIGGLITASEIGSKCRAYMLEFVRNENSAHPAPAALVAMVREETSQACVGKLSNLLLVVEDRAKVLADMGAMISDPMSSAQTRCNALQILQALRDKDGLPHVHNAIRAEMNRGADNSKPVLRRAFEALKSTPDASSMAVITDFQASEICTSSWEMTRYSWVAYSMIDSDTTNLKVEQMFKQETNLARKKFFHALLPSNKVYRELLIIHPET